MPILRKGERCEPHQERVNLRYYAVPNVHKPRGGWMPVYRDNTGREHGDTYGRGMDRDRAVRVARVAAYREGKRYRGDYCVVIGPGQRRKRQPGDTRAEIDSDVESSQVVTASDVTDSSDDADSALHG